MSVPFDGSGDPHILKIAAARVIASEQMPYLASVIYAMVPVRVEGLNTFASDDRWRMYWDPQAVDRWDVQEIAGAVLHEAGHCYLGHGPRFAAMGEPNSNARLFNIAGDSLINVDLRDAHVSLPEGAVYVEMLPGANREMSSEQIYRLLAEQACTCDSAPQSGQGDEQSDDTGDTDQASDDTGDDSGEGSEQGQQPNPQQGDGQRESGGAGRPDPNCPVHGHKHGPGDGDGSGGTCDDPNCTAESLGWDCGSAADGIRREYEAEGDKVDPGVDEARADLIREQASVEILRHSRNRGDVPAGMLRRAKEIVEPVIDWRRELASLVRRQVATVRGRRDYTYTRPSRRQASMKAAGQKIILPAMRQPPPPNVAVVIDTSGSMSDDMLTWAISETQGVLRNSGSSDSAVRIYSCDAHSSTAQKVRRAEDIKLSGGGGTDMRVGIGAAMADKPAPDAVILVTDGYTPYPDEPLAHGALLIVALTDDAAADQVPDWARKVIITR